MKNLNAMLDNETLSAVPLQYSTKEIRVLPNARALKALNALLEWDHALVEDLEEADDQTSDPSVFDAIYSMMHPLEAGGKDPEYTQYIADKHFREKIEEIISFDGDPDLLLFFQGKHRKDRRKPTPGFTDAQERP